jgi:hypothetical protein
MDSKIKIKLGAIEIEYEGSEGFLKQELPDLIKTVAGLYKEANMRPLADLGGGGGGGSDDGDSVQLSTASIATKLRCKSGPNLAVAAAAHLTLAKNIGVFTRKALLVEMQTATSFYKSSYSKNLSKTLKTLLKGDFNEPSSGRYCLTEAKKKEVRSALA